MSGRAEFMRLWNDGASAAEIRGALGLSSEHYVYTKARALGLPRRRWKDNPKYRAMVPFAEEIVYAKEEGLSIRAVAEELGVSRTYPYKIYGDFT